MSNFMDLKKAVINWDEKWIERHFRHEWIYHLGRIVELEGLYDSALNGSMYSYWKMEQSERLMSVDDPPKMEYFSRENAWGMLWKIHEDVDKEIPRELIVWMSTTADVI